jgi:DNA ligase (NAD+)
VITDLRKGNEKVFKMITECPVCEHSLEKKNIGDRDARKMANKKIEKSAAWYCTNKKCPAKDRKKLYYFTSKKVFNIDGLGPKIIDALCDNGLVSIPADFFTLEKGDVLALPRFGELSVDNLFESIEKSKVVDLSRLIASLGIPQVGEETAYDLAETFGNIEGFLNATETELSSMFGVGIVIAREIVEWKSDKSNIHNLEKLLKYLEIVNPEKNKIKNTNISGKTFVLTGTLESMDRDVAKAKIKEMGGSVLGTVSKNTDYLVVGENAGSKLQKAEELGVKILSESEFKKLLG